jgi:hypothetical protein
MPKQILEEEFNNVLQAVAHFTVGGSLEDIRRVLENTLARRTLQRRLALLVEQKRLTIEGHGRGRRYRLPDRGGVLHLKWPKRKLEFHEGDTYIPISSESEPIKKYAETQFPYDCDLQFEYPPIAGPALHLFRI